MNNIEGARGAIFPVSKPEKSGDALEKLPEEFMESSSQPRTIENNNIEDVVVLSPEALEELHKDRNA